MSEFFFYTLLYEPELTYGLCLTFYTIHGFYVVTTVRGREIEFFLHKCAIVPAHRLKLALYNHDIELKLIGYIKFSS
jgi:hypothetical protein